MEIGRPSPEPSGAGVDRVVILGWTAHGSAATGWCERVRELLDDQSTARVICDLTGLTGSVGEVVDGLARVQLTAIRCGGELRFRGADPALVELFELLGLQGVLREDSARCPNSAAGQDDRS